MKKKLLVPFIALLALLLSAAPSAAVTYDPDPPIAGQPLTIEHSFDWPGCSSTTGNWTYTYTITMVAPDGTEVVFEVINETGAAPAPAQTLSGSATQTLPDIPGDWTVNTRTTSFCGRLGQASATTGTVSVAEDATVPVVDPTVGVVFAGVSIGAFLVWKKTRKPELV